MSLKAGIDVGGSNTHGVLMDGDKVKATVTIEGNTEKDALDCYERLLKEAGSEGFSLVLTGGNARKVRKGGIPQEFTEIGEIESIGRGAVHITGRKDVFAISAGTGTAFVSVKGGKPSHLGGTGIGGGTIKGLSGLLVGGGPAEAEKLASRGSGKMDITVKDIVGSGIGRIPASATASNFGRAGKGLGREEAALSMLKMVGETIGVTSYFAARTVGQEKDMVLCGQVSANAVVRKKVLFTVDMFGGKAEVPRYAEHCGAIGAALYG